MRRYGSSAAESTDWLSDTSIGLRKMYGPFARTAKVCVTLGLWVATQSMSLSYGFPVITAAEYWDISSPILLTGHIFGSFDTTLRGRIGSTGCTSSLWISETSMQCNVAFSEFLLGQRVAAIVTVALNEGASFQDALQYNNDNTHTVVTSIVPSRSSSRGSSNCFIYGTGFPAIVHGRLEMWSLEVAGPVLKHTFCPDHIKPASEPTFCQSNFGVVFNRGYFCLVVDIPPGQGDNISFVYTVTLNSTIPKISEWKRLFGYISTEVFSIRFQGLSLNVTSGRVLDSGPFMLPTASVPESRLVTIFGISLGTSDDPSAFLHSSILGSIELTTTRFITLNSSQELVIFELPSFQNQDLNISLTLLLKSVQLYAPIVNSFAVLDVGNVYARVVLKTAADNYIASVDSFQRAEFHLNLATSLLQLISGSSTNINSIVFVKRTFLFSVVRGSVSADFCIFPLLDEFSGNASSAWIQDARTLFTAYERGQLSTSLERIGTLTYFGVFNLPSLPTSVQQTYQPFASSDSSRSTGSPPASTSLGAQITLAIAGFETSSAANNVVNNSTGSGGWDQQLVILLSAGLSAVVALLLCCLYVQIRIALRSDEVLLKAAFDALANREEEPALEVDAVASQNPVGTPRSIQSFSTPRVVLQTPAIQQTQRTGGRRSADGVNPLPPEENESTPADPGIIWSLAVNETLSPQFADSLRNRLNEGMRAGQEQYSNPEILGSNDSRGPRGWNLSLAVPTPSLIRSRLSHRLLAQNVEATPSVDLQQVDLGTNTLTSSALGPAASDGQSSLRGTLSKSGQGSNEAMGVTRKDAQWDSRIGSEWDLLNSAAYQRSLQGRSGNENRRPQDGLGRNRPRVSGNSNIFDLSSQEANRGTDRRAAAQTGIEQDNEYFSASEPESSLQERFAVADDFFSPRPTANNPSGSEREQSSRRQFRRRLLQGFNLNLTTGTLRNREDRGELRGRPESLNQGADEDYFSASDPESSLQQRFENLDDDQADSGTVFDESQHSLEKTRSQIHPRSLGNNLMPQAQSSRGNRQPRQSADNAFTAHQRTARVGSQSSGVNSGNQISGQDMMAARTERRVIEASNDYAPTSASESAAAREEPSSALQCELEEMSWDPCSESHRDPENADDDVTSERQIRGPFTANASFGTMTYAPDNLEGHLEIEHSESTIHSDEAAETSVDPSAVYVSLAPMSRAHARDDPKNRRTRQAARLRDEWDHTSVQAARVPYNTPVQPERPTNLSAQNSA